MSHIRARARGAQRSMLLSQTPGASEKPETVDEKKTFVKGAAAEKKLCLRVCLDDRAGCGGVLLLLR